jgi:trigger factor
VEAETCKRELLIEIPVEAVRQESDKVTARYSRSVRVPGFRPGHAPAQVVRQRYREEIKSEVVQALLPKFFNSALKDRHLSAVGQPEFEDLRFEEGQPLTCKATFEVLPEFELKQYKGLEVEKETEAITEAEVDKGLEELRESAATYEVVSDRPAKDGDDVTVSYLGRDPKDPKAEPIEGREVIIHLDAQDGGAFDEHLRGAKGGDTLEFEVSYPEDSPSKRLAGKTISYRVEVHGIKRKVLPAVDDELARTVSEFSALDELRAKVRQDVERLHRRNTEKTVRQRLVEQLLKDHEFPVPASMVNDRLQHRMESAVAQLMARGIDPRSAHLDWGKLREKMQPEAEQAVRAAIILERIAEAEKIEVSEEELDQSIREIAQQRGEAPATLKTRLTRDGGLAKLQSSCRSQKALDFVYHNAQITHPMDQDEQVQNTAGQTS